MLPLIGNTFSDPIGADEPEVSVGRVQRASITSTSAERAGYVDWTRFAPVIGDTLWRDAGVLPSGDGFTWWLACAL